MGLSPSRNLPHPPSRDRPDPSAFFIVAQLIGMTLAVAVGRWLWADATSVLPKRVRALGGDL
jgi:hypothetical protein